MMSPEYLRDLLNTRRCESEGEVLPLIGALKENTDRETLLLFNFEQLRADSFLTSSST